MWPSIEAFPFLKRGRPQPQDGLDTPAPGSPRRGSQPSKAGVSPPSVHLNLERKGYRPGDMVVATIEVSNDAPSARRPAKGTVADAVLMEDLLVEVKGIEKLDPQWLVTPKPAPGSKQRRGERCILESLPTSIVSNVLIGHGSSKTFMVRTMLPTILPPTYRGTAVRYLYYISVTLRWAHAIVENGHGPGQTSQSGLDPVEVRTPLPIWTMPNSSGLTSEELQAKDHYRSYGIVPSSPIEVEIQWKEKNDEASWAWALNTTSGYREDRISSEESGSSTLNSPVKLLSLEPAFEHTSRVMTKESLDPSAQLAYSNRVDMLAGSTEELVLDPGSNSQRFENAPNRPAAQKKAGNLGSSVSEGPEDSQTANGSHVWPAGNMNGYEGGYGSYSGRVEEEIGIGSPRSPAVAYNRGRSYNIRMDDQVLVRFSPKNTTSTFYYGDMVAGTLQFFHDEGPRRCLEVSAVLETREVLNLSSVHPSRKNSSTITKVQSEYYEVVCDMINTHFLFSIPMDGPASFSTPLVSVQWVLRFEFVASQPDVDWSKIEHPLLLDLSERHKGEWSMPLTVHAPLPRTHTAGASKAKKERGDIWVPSPRASTVARNSFNLSSSGTGLPQRGDGASSSGGSPGL